MSILIDVKAYKSWDEADLSIDGIAGQFSVVRAIAGSIYERQKDGRIT